MRTLLVTSVGGHLTQLHRLVEVLQGIERRRLWVTFDTPQSRSMLAGEEVIFLDYTGPRDVANVLRHTRTAKRLFGRKHQFSTVVSAGSGIALSFLPLAHLRGASCHYIESFTRTSGPSLTGRVLSHVPGIAMYTQYPGWSTSRWTHAGSVFDAFAAGAPSEHDGEIRRAVVTLGTMEDYSFRRLVERALEVLPTSAEVLWQVGCTDVADLPIRARVSLPAHELQQAIADADVVVAHAGCGSALAALEAGKKPVLVPRSAAHAENVDDHQALLAQELARRGLAVVCPVEKLGVEEVRGAARSSVRAAPRTTPFRLRV